MYEAARQFAPRTTHVHVKNISYPPEWREVQGHGGLSYREHSCPIDVGDIDHARMLSILKEAGYEGGIYIEDESLAKYDPSRRVENITRTIGYLRGILEGIDVSSS